MQIKFKNYLNCTKPLIQILDDDLYEVLGQVKEFWSYKWFPKKNKLNDYIANKRVRIIPCGQCLPCLNIRRYKWVMKLKAEKKKWKYSYFITLTYNNENCTNELIKKDLKIFLQNLDYEMSDKKHGWYNRFHRDDNYKFMACGEYGSKTERPHYHIVLLTNYKFKDMEFYKNSKTGPLYNSYTLSKLWNNKGWAVISYDYGQGESFGYTVSYSNKNYLKQKNNLINAQIKNKIDSINSDLYANYSGWERYLLIDNIIQIFNTYKIRQPEFLSSSRRPPIGSDCKDYDILPSEVLKWIQKNKLITEDDFIKIDDEINKRKNRFDEFLNGTDINAQITNNNQLLENFIKKNKNAKGHI